MGERAKNAWVDLDALGPQVELVEELGQGDVRVAGLWVNDQDGPTRVAFGLRRAIGRGMFPLAGARGVVSSGVPREDRARPTGRCRRSAGCWRGPPLPARPARSVRRVRVALRAAARRWACRPVGSSGPTRSMQPLGGTQSSRRTTLRLDRAARAGRSACSAIIGVAVRRPHAWLRPGTS